jgi:hypothetical protein
METPWALFVAPRLRGGPGGCILAARTTAKRGNELEESG